MSNFVANLIRRGAGLSGVAAGIAPTRPFALAAEPEGPESLAPDTAITFAAKAEQAAGGSSFVAPATRSLLEETQVVPPARPMPQTSLPAVQPLQVWHKALPPEIVPGQSSVSRSGAEEILLPDLLAQPQSHASSAPEVLEVSSPNVPAIMPKADRTQVVAEMLSPPTLERSRLFYDITSSTGPAAEVAVAALQTNAAQRVSPPQTTATEPVIAPRREPGVPLRLESQPALERQPVFESDSDLPLPSAAMIVPRPAEVLAHGAALIGERTSADNSSPPSIHVRIGQVEVQVERPQQPRLISRPAARSRGFQDFFRTRNYLG